jgi:PAS domain S-box-containing protein
MNHKVSTSLETHSVPASRKVGPEHHFAFPAWERIGRFDLRPHLRGYLLALLAVFLAFVWRLLIDPWLGDQMPYTTFIVAVAVAGFYAGVRSAIVAMLLGAVTAYFCFVSPRYRWGFAGVPDEVGFSVYVLGALGVVLLTRARDKAVNRFTASLSDVRESESRLHALADNIPQLAWMADETGRRFWYNQRWFDYTGTSIEQMRGMGWEKVHHPDHNQRVMQRIRQSWESGGIWEDTFPLRGKDGSYRWFLSRAFPIRDDDGRVVRWFGTNTDVSERISAEEALRRSEKLASVGKVVATVAHELNNPLAIAVNHVFLAQNDPNSVTRTEHLHLAEMELRRAAGLANRTLSFYGGNTSRETLSIATLVREVLEIFGKMFMERNIVVKTELDAAAFVFASKQELWQVLVNLFSNSLDAIGKNGIIRVRATVGTDSHTGAPVLRLTMADSGCGIDQHDRKKVFEPFFTTKGSSGLGLWITKGIVQSHDGRMQLHSCTKPGSSGTVISLEIPVATVKKQQVFGRAS